MAAHKNDRRFGARFMLRSALLCVPPAAAIVFSWTTWERRGVDTWLGIAFFLAWITFWMVADARALRTYRCPTCRRLIARPTMTNRTAGDPINYYCSACDTEWHTGLREAND